MRGGVGRGGVSNTGWESTVESVHSRINNMDDVDADFAVIWISPFQVNDTMITEPDSLCGRLADYRCVGSVITWHNYYGVTGWLKWQSAGSDSRSKDRPGFQPPSGAQEKCVRVFPESKLMLCWLAVSVPQPLRMITYARKKSCSPCQSSVDYGNTKQTQHALVGLGSAALAAAVIWPREDGPNFPKGIINCIQK